MANIAPKLFEFDLVDELFDPLENEVKKTLAVSQKEAFHLAWLATQVSQDGIIVEVGSYQGISVCAMALACRQAGINPKIFAVDLWTTGRGKTFDNYTTQTVWKNFIRRMKRFDLQGHIIPIKGDSLTVANERKTKIDLLHLDANHSYDHVKADFEAWSPHIKSGGWIALHDYSNWFPGVQKVVDEMLVPSNEWDNFCVVGREFSARKK